MNELENSMQNEAKKVQRGFTLIEILLVIGIIAVLATVVIVALNPGQRFLDARNAERRQDIQNISSAIHQYIIDNKGVFPPNLTETDAEKQLSTSTSGCEMNGGGCATGDSDCVDLTSDLAPYLKSIPQDPGTGTETHSRYTVLVSDYNIVTVRACEAEGEEIYISR